jgi:hypothetical protein
MLSKNNIILGEFWVGSDGEIFVDIDDPLQAMEDLYRFQKIQALQRKLPLANDQQAPSMPPPNYRNRPRQARRKRKGYSSPEVFRQTGVRLSHARVC